jgi:hypothetical protein
MTLLILISMPFVALGYLVPRAWTVVVPFVAWMAVAWLGELGILSGRPSLASALLAGGLGALFALAGFFLGRRKRAALR